MSRMTADDRDSLRKALDGCDNWRVVDGVYVGECNGWIFSIADKATCEATAAHTELKIVTTLSPQVARAWFNELQSRGIL